MTRRIETVSYQSTDGQEKPADGYPDRVVKYVPADVVAAWIAATNVLKTANVPRQNVLWACFAFGVVATAAWTWRQTKKTGAPALITQIFVSTLAFCVWVFGLGEPFASLSWYDSVYGSLALIAFTLISGAIVPKV
jgi:hypothetical protein